MTVFYQHDYNAEFVGTCRFQLIQNLNMGQTKHDVH